MDRYGYHLGNTYGYYRGNMWNNVTSMALTGLKFTVFNIGILKTCIIVAAAVVIISLIVSIWGWYTRSENFVQEDYQPRRCVCAFDLDNTLVCKGNRPQGRAEENAVELCKQMGCQLAINTARPAKYYRDIDLGGMGFQPEYFTLDDFYYNPISWVQSSERVAQIKSNYLDHLATKYSIPRKECVVLIDDHPNNLMEAMKRGFGVVHSSSGDRCGITPENVQELNNILSRC